MQKRAVSKSIKVYSLTQIFLLVCMTFAIAFLLGQEIKTVSAAPITINVNQVIYQNGKSYTVTDIRSGYATVVATGTTTPISFPLSTVTAENGYSLAQTSPSLLTNANGAGAGISYISASTSPNHFTLTSPLTIGSTTVPAGTIVTSVGTDASGKTLYQLSNGDKIAVPVGQTVSLSSVTQQQAFQFDNPTLTPTTQGANTVFTRPDSSTVLFDVSGKLAGGNIAPKVYSPYKSDKILGFYQSESFFVGNMLEGLQTAIGVAGFIALGAQLFGASAQTTKAISTSVGAGIFGAKLARALAGSGTKAGTTGQGLFGPLIKDATANWIGLAIGIAVFVATYKQEKQQLVSFACMPWEPPLGGSSCEQCNADPFRPCSEYRCKSLGQACQLLNAGTGKESCAWVSPKDVTSPTITEWDAALKPAGLVFNPDNAVRPGARGVKIIAGTADGCLPAFTPLQFGILTNEPAQCKIDYNRTGSFDKMVYYFGGSNYYEYNHTQIMRLPSPNSADSNLAPLLQNDGSFNMYVRCRDANGNANVDEYSINFCVSAGPDTTPPIIEGTSITDGSPVQSGADKVPIEVYVNEPAICKWSKQDREFDSMENTMNCATQTSQVNANLQYTCSGNLTGVADMQNNSFFFRCKDQPTSAEAVRNVMRQSYSLSLVGTEPLAIISVGPNSTVTASTSSVPVDLTVETAFGASEGKATCRFSTNGADGSYIDMYNTNNAFHKQPLSLSAGNYIYYIRCVDAGGNLVDTNTTFTVKVDAITPIVTRVYKEEPEMLKIVTNENAQCVYSLNNCNYEFKDGIKFSYQNAESQVIHTTTWKTNTPFYIKCRDSYGNEPNPSSCNIIATGLNLGVRAKTGS